MNVTPRGGYEEWTKDTPADNAPPVRDMDGNQMDTTIDDFEPVDPMDLEEEDAHGSLNGPSVNPSAASISTSRGKSSKKRTEAMFITLVHGDILILSGDEFEVSKISAFGGFDRLTGSSTHCIVLEWAFVSVGSSFSSYIELICFHVA